MYLEPYGWYRIDARGNKEGVAADFYPPVEKLAFPVVTPGEADFSEIWTEPVPVVLDVLSSYKTYKEVADNLPDIQIVIIEIKKMQTWKEFDVWTKLKSFYSTWAASWWS